MQSLPPAKRPRARAVSINHSRDGISSNRWLALLLAALLAVTATLSPGAKADLIGSELIAQELELEAKRDSLQGLLAREEVRDYLAKHGVAEADVDTRVANLTDAEVLELHQMMDQLPLGEGAGALETVVLILLIFILLDVAGVTDIFPGI